MFHSKSFDKMDITKINEYDYILHCPVNHRTDSISFTDKIKIIQKKDSMDFIILSDESKIVIKLDSILMGIIKDIDYVHPYTNHRDIKDMTIEKETDQIKYKIIFNQFSFTQDGNEISDIRHPSFRMYFRIKKKQSD